MPIVRCYVPLDAAQLTMLRDARHLPGPLPAATVTRTVREGAPGADEEEWEYAAQQAAAARLLAARAPVVLAAVDLVTELVDAERPDGAFVQVAHLDLPRVAALHLGDDVVTGDPDALAGTSADEEIELSWYDTTEIAHVVELARALGGATGPDA